MKFVSALIAIPLILVFGITRPAVAADNEKITIVAGRSYVLDTPADLQRIVVSTEDVIEAVAVSQREVVFNAKAPGETSVVIWFRKGAGRRAYDITVTPSSSKEISLRRRLQAEIGDSIEGSVEDKMVVLRGDLQSQAQGDKAMAIASIYGTPLSLMTIATPAAAAQVLLKVRFADVDRTASLSLGANIFSTGAGNTVGSTSTQQFASPSPTGANGSQFTLSNALNVFLFRKDLNLGATIEALEAKNLVQILAEPNVLATDGKQASFLAGGEFPFPVVQSSGAGLNTVTIQFREFGIRLSFTPRITARGTIKLEVSPEVSSLDYANGLSYAGFTIPGLDVRKVKTEIELENNQSFAIAGLLDNRVTENLSKVPGLGDIPILGKIFQSRATTRSNSELLVVVTPELVQPLSESAGVPALTMPKQFIKTGSTDAPDAANAADTKPLAVQPRVPFVPTEAPSDKTASEDGGPIISKGNKGFLKAN